MTTKKATTKAKAKETETTPATTATTEVAAFIPNISMAAIANVKKKRAEAKTFIEPISITYKTSQAFEKGLAKIGEFFFNGQSLGKETNMHPVQLMHKLVARDEGGGYTDSICFSGEIEDYSIEPAYLEFMTKNSSSDIGYGIALCVYIEAAEDFGEFYCNKKGTMDGGEMALAHMMDGNASTMETKMVAGKKGTHAELIVTPADPVPFPPNTAELISLVLKDISEPAKSTRKQ